MSTKREDRNIQKLKQQFADGKMNRREFLRYSTLLGLSAAAAYGVAGKITGHGLLPAARAADIPMGGTIRLGMRVLGIDNAHTIEWIDPSNITINVMQQLAITGADNITRPVLLEKWEPSEDLKTWTLHLRKEARWRNGRAFVADDVVWNLNHILDPATGSSALGLFKSYMLEEYDTGKKDDDGKPVMSTKLWDANAIEKIDDHTVRLNLKVPQVAVPEHLDNYTNVMSDPEEGGKFTLDSNGTGHFKLVELKVGELAVFEKVKDHWLADAYADRIEYIDLGDDPSAWIAALASNQVHGVSSVGADQLQVVQNLPHLQIYEAHTANTAVCQMKVKRKPFDHPAVRKAFRYATDSGEIVKLALSGYGLPGEHHLVCPIHPDYAELPEMTRDPAKAKALLAEAGYPDGIDVEFNIKKDPAWQLAAAQAMVEQWKAADIRAKLNVMPSAQFWDVWDKFDFGYVDWAHRPLGFMVLSLGFRTGVPWNAPEFENQAFDELLTKAEGTFDIDERREIMKQIEVLMQEEGPIAQPLWYSLITAMNKQIKGFQMHPKNHFYLHEMGIES